jgi:2-polyprenyl-3-methyl-5-hydroxy-6-metoxy-1,4-benzoquinol methylase
MIFDKLAPYYGEFVDKELNNYYLSQIDRSFQGNGVVIDLGCGTGELAVELAKRGYYVTATDLSETMLEYANNNAVLSGVSIQFYVHNILYPLNRIYDILVMSSDVINNIHEKEDILKVFKNIAASMDENSQFMFDFIHTQYIEKIHNYQQDILLQDNLLQWTVRKTSVEHQIEHKLMFGVESETQLQTTYPLKVYKKLLNEAGLGIVKKKRTDERVILVVKLK